MNMQKPLKCAAAVISAVLVCAGSMSVVTAEATLSGSEETALVSDIYEMAEVQDSSEDDTETEWWKAEITDYDSSLSLISYELTPDITETKDEETDESDEDTDDEDDESSKYQVESQTTGGTVGDIPQAQSSQSINASSGEFAFVTYGWGHGVGMSQNGANYYAMYSGWSYQDILYHYYPGTYLMNTGTASSETLTVNGVSGDALSIVSGIVYREIGGSMSTEAIKAQAVAVYSYIKYYGNNAKDLSCKSNPPQNVIDACASVLGEVLYYDGTYALTMFCASSGGYTANCYEVFTNDIPYLRSVSSDYDASCDPHYGTVSYITSLEVKRLVEACYGITLSGDHSSWFTLVTGSSGYVSEVVIDRQITVKGNDLKACLGLKSPKFEVTYTA
ncbi:MAG: sporulation protein [Ruminococcus sp.]|nr:sporulation protein [Ruminococcus sp.]